MIVAQAAIAQSVATAVMPTFSAQYAQGKLDDLRQTLASALRGVILLSVPATAGLILLSVPLITFLYQRGEFTAETTNLVAWALTWYATGLVFHSVLEVLVRAFYSMHDTKTPVLVGAAAMTLSIGLSLLFASIFQSLGWLPHGGLALAVSVSTALEVTTLFLIMRIRLKGIHGTQIARGFGIATLATLCMGAVLLGWTRVAASHSAALVTLGGVLIGGTVYAAILVAMRIPEVGSVVRMVKRRFTR
jgi:putative peptidoglycan lipid II flippase